MVPATWKAEARSLPESTNSRLTWATWEEPLPYHTEVKQRKKRENVSFKKVCLLVLFGIQQTLFGTNPRGGEKGKFAKKIFSKKVAGCGGIHL